MKGERGAALIWLLLAALLFFLLGGALLQTAFSDLRIGGYLLAAEQAHYAAEAGIETAAAVLGPLCRDLGEEGWSFEHPGEPSFAVRAEREEGQVLRITATGSAGNRIKVLEVLAYLRPLGRQALTGGAVKLQEAKVTGHISADEVVFAGGHNSVHGDLRALRVEVDPGGSYTCSGCLCSDGRPYNTRIDFAGLAWEALFSGWTEIAADDGCCLVESLESGPAIAAGDTEIMPQAPLAGLLVALGNVVIGNWVNGSRLAVVANGDVLLCGSGNEWEGSLFVASSGRIANGGERPLVFSGCLVAPSIVLGDATVNYCDAAVLDNIFYLPSALLRLQPTFDLEWLEKRPRR
jgi:hypothetical protein